MKKWMYVIFPGSGLAIFLVFFLSHTKEMEQREAVRQAEVTRQLAEADAAKKVAEEKAHKDAQARAEQHAAEEAEKAAAKAAKQAAADKEVKDATDKALAEGDKFAQEAARLEIELDRLHKEKDRLNRQAFETAQQVELAKVARRTAELEEQRTIAMIADKAEKSYLTRMPPPPPPPKS